MIAELKIVEGAYLRDILEQPEALRRSLEGFAAGEELRGFAAGIAAGRYERIVLTGMGSSLHALYPLHLRLVEQGLPSMHVETAELIHYQAALLRGTTLVVAVSQSGQSAEIVRLLAMARGKCPVVGVTNNDSGALALLADAAVMIRAGVESTVSCKTYVATLAALEWLGAVLTGGDDAAARGVLQSAVPAMSEYLVGWRGHVEEWWPILGGVKQIFTVGRGASLAAALTGGLILKESTRFAAEGMSCAAFRHGPFETLGSHVLVTMLAGDAKARSLNGSLAEDILRAGGRLALIDRWGLSVPEAIRPILEILPLQMMTLALAAMLGREAGRFELATKVTDVE